MNQEEMTNENVDISSEENKTEEVLTEKEKTKKQTKSKEAKLKEEIESLKNELAKNKEDFLRARADLENTKKRLNDEAILNRKYASMKLVESLINPVDMLIKASSMNPLNEEMKNFLIGFNMIANQITEAMKADGLSEIVTKAGDSFDANVHHAMATEKKDGVEPNLILEVLQTGYKYKNRLIRPAMVKVSE